MNTMKLKTSLTLLTVLLWIPVAGADDAEKVSHESHYAISAQGADHQTAGAGR